MYLPGSSPSPSSVSVPPWPPSSTPYPTTPIRPAADPLAVAALEDIRHRVAVGDRPVRPPRRGALGEAQIGLRERRPFAAVRIEAVNVDHRRDRGTPRDHAQRRVACAEEQSD